MRNKIKELIKTKDPDCIRQAMELVLSMSTEWNPKFIESNRLYNLRGKVFSYESFILFKDADLTLMLIPYCEMHTVPFQNLSYWQGYYYYINNATKNGTLGGPRTLLKLLKELDFHLYSRKPDKEKK